MNSTLYKFERLPLGSYDVVIGMDWLESDCTVVNCYNKTIGCIDNEGKPRTIKIFQGKSPQDRFQPCNWRSVLEKNVNCMQLVLKPSKNKGPKLDDFPILQEFKDVCPDEILGLCPRRNIDTNRNT